MDLADLKKLVAHVESLRNRRLKEWRELSALFLPSRGMFPGEEKDSVRKRRLFNNAGQRALSKAAAGMTAAMTPADYAWFKHQFALPGDRELTGAGQFVDEIDERIRKTLAAGGFYDAIHAFNKELLCFCCALLYVETSNRTAARYSCPTCGTWAIALDSDRTLACVIHRLTFTVVELIEHFGSEKVSEATRKKKDSEPYASVEVVHVVMKRRDRDEAKHDNKNLPFASYWYEDANGDGLLAESGYHEMPYMFTVWEDARGIYGTGPGDLALSDQKAIESYELRKCVGLEKTIDPPWIAPGTGKDRLRTDAGAINSVSMANSQQFIPLFPGGFIQGIQHVQQEIQSISGRIDETLMATIFAAMPLDQRPKDMSATEYLDRRRKAAQLMGPAISAYEPNVLSRVIERTYGILDRAGFLPLVPESVGEFAYLDVSYESPMSQMLSQTGAEAIQAFLQVALPLVQADPQALDKVDVDQIIDEVSRRFNVPASVIRSDEQVAALREERTRQQAAQEQAAQEQAVMKQIAELGNTSTQGTIAGEVLGSAQGAQTGGTANG